MNTHMDFQPEPEDALRPLIDACTASCKKLVSKMNYIKGALLAEFRQQAFTREQMLRLALIEAEALAHETGFPLLTFPMLAREKLEAVAAWNRNQHVIRRAALQRLAA